MDPNLEIRLGRARSWIQIAGSIPASETKNISEDVGVITAREHERFIFYWIALNCLYGRHSKNGQDNPDKPKDSETRTFLDKVAQMSRWDLDEGTQIIQTAVDQPETKRLAEKLIRDYFLDRRYWEGRLHIQDLKDNLEKEWGRVEASLIKGSHDLFLTSSLERLKMLRNQIMHGSVTYGRRSKGWDSLETGALLVSRIVPALVQLVSRYGDRCNWDPAPYPRLGYLGHPRPSSITVRK